jgi:preprotein translocase subunit SecG
MIYVFASVHVIACLFLIVVVLLQSGQAADLAGAFGGMGSQTVFGPRGSATIMTKATAWVAVIFMVTSLSLAILGTRRGSPTAGSVLNDHVKSAPAQAPAKQQPKPAAPKQ